MDKEQLNLFEQAIQQITNAQDLLSSQENPSKDMLRKASFELGVAIGMLIGLQREERKHNRVVDELEKG